MARRKWLARGERRAARARVAELAGAPIGTILSGRAPADLAGRAAPRWPSAAEAGGDFARRFPEAAHAAVGEADLLLDGRLRLFGALHDVRRREGAAVEPLRLDWDYAPRGGDLEIFRDDPKFPWEVARLAALPRLGVAHVVTGRARYAEAAAGIVLDWAATRPVGEGRHYDSALEVGIRLIALCQAFHFFAGTRAFDGAPLETLLRQAAQMAAWLDGHRSVERVVAGNHLLGELAGLVVADLYFPELGHHEIIFPSRIFIARYQSHSTRSD